MYAAQYDQSSVVQLLADKESGMQNNAGWSALHFAAQNGSRDSIRILLKYESHIKNKKGARAIDIAI